MDKDKEIEKLKSALADAVHSFTRMETLYKLKCNELESAKDEIAGLTGKVEALQQDNENLRRTLEYGRSYEYRDSCVGCELADICKYSEHYNFCEDCKEYPDCSCVSYDTLPCGRHVECNNGFEEKSYLDDEDEEGENDE